MNRRDFITLIGGGAAWPLAARAQQRAMPVIGYLSGRTADSDASMLASVRRGLGDVGYTEGRNVAIEYRFADGRYDRLSAQLADLTQRKVGVIVCAGFASVEEVLRQVRTSLIPIVINTADPIELGLVASITRPGGNVTGVYPMSPELAGKQLGLLHDLVPKAATIAALVDPIGPIRENIILRDARDATATLGQKLLVLEASTAEEIDGNLPGLTRNRRRQCSWLSPRFFSLGRTDDQSRTTHQYKNRQAANGRRAIRARLDCSATRRTIHPKHLKEDEPAAMVIRPLLKTVILIRIHPDYNPNTEEPLFRSEGLT